MVMYGPLWSLMVPFGPNGPVLSHMVRMVLYEPVWFSRVLYGTVGFVWSHLFPFGPVLSPMVQYFPV